MTPTSPLSKEVALAELAVATAIVRLRGLFEAAPYLIGESQVPGCGIVTFGDLKAIQEYADAQFEASTPAVGTREADPVMWVCLVLPGEFPHPEGSPEPRLRAWTTRRERADLFKADGLDMQPLYALRSAPTGAGLKEATAAQHFDLPKGTPAQFVRNGVLETCQCNRCATLQSVQPPAGERMRDALETIAAWKKVNIAGEYEHGLRDIIRSITDCAERALSDSHP